MAIAVGLRLASTTTVSGVESSAVAALTKLDQVLSATLRERVRTIHATTVELPAPPLPSVDVDVLVAVAAACRGSEELRFSYRTFAGDEGERTVEPYRLVHSRGRWYLVARDRRRRAWRTYRVDRITEPAPTGHRFVVEDPPDVETLVSEGTTVAPWGVRAVLRLHLDADEAVRRYPPSVCVV